MRWMSVNKRGLLALGMMTLVGISSPGTTSPVQARSKAVSSMWQGSVGKYTVRIAPDKFQLVTPVSRDLVMPLSDQGDSEMLCTSERNIQGLSWVGPFLSFESGRYWNCLGTAHPGAVTNYETLNVETRKPVSLTDIFEDQVLLKALLNDGVIKRHVPANMRFASSTHLMNYLNTQGTGQCEYYFSKDNLSRFAFHHIKNNQVAVRMGLSHGCEAARGNLTQLGFYLPIPPGLKSAFRQASARKEGFLMGRAPKVTFQQKVNSPGFEEAVEKMLEDMNE